MTPRRSVVMAAAVTTVLLPMVPRSSVTDPPPAVTTSAPATVVLPSHERTWDGNPPATVAGATTPTWIPPTTIQVSTTTTTVDLGPAIVYAAGLWAATSTTSTVAHHARVVNGAGRAVVGDWCVRTEGGHTYTAPAAFLAAIDAHLGGDRQTWCRIGWREGRWKLDPPGNRSYACTLQVWWKWVAKAGTTMAATRASYDTCAAVAARALHDQGMSAWAATA